MCNQIYYLKACCIKKDKRKKVYQDKWERCRDRGTPRCVIGEVYGDRNENTVCAECTINRIGPKERTDPPRNEPEYSMASTFVPPEVAQRGWPYESRPPSTTPLTPFSSPPPEPPQEHGVIYNDNVEGIEGGTISRTGPQSKAEAKAAWIAEIPSTTSRGNYTTSRADLGEHRWRQDLPCSAQDPEMIDKCISGICRSRR